MNIYKQLIFWIGCGVAVIAVAAVADDGLSGVAREQGVGRPEPIQRQQQGYKPEGALAPNAPHDEDLRRRIEIVATASKAEFAQLEPVTIAVEYTNVSDETVLIRGTSDKYRSFDIRAERDGQAVPWTCLGDWNHTTPDKGIGKATYPLIPAWRPDRAGAVYPRKIHLDANLLRDMTRPGEYTLIVELEVFNPGLTTKSVARSRPVKVKIVDRPNP